MQSLASHFFRFKTRTPYILSLVFFILISTVVKSEYLEIGNKNRPFFKNISLNRTEIFWDRDQTENIRLAPESNAGASENILHLDFDANPPVLLKDTTGNYRILESNYTFLPETQAGKGAALFTRKEDRIKIQSPENLWPHTDFIGDFSIEMWIKPTHLSWKNTIFKKHGLESSFTNNNNQKIEIFLNQNRIHFLCQNLFQNAGGNPKSIALTSRTELQNNEWVHLHISYNAENGKVGMFINGKEENVRYAKDLQGIWAASMGILDRSPIVIGESYTGAIDEFRITNRPLNNESEIRFSRYSPLDFNPVHLIGKQSDGIALSDVITLPNSQISKSARLRYESLEPEGTQLNFWIRYSNKSFQKNQSQEEIPWHLIRNETQNIPEFTHIQWKTKLRSNPEGSATPVLKDIRIDYTPYQKPVAPRNLKTIDSLSVDARVCLDWIRNPESEMQSGGYIIYYGVRSKEYYGKLMHIDENKTRTINVVALNDIPLSEEESRKKTIRPIAFKKDLANHIRLIIDNNLIEKNIISNIRNGSDIRMPFLENNRTYYFSVSAYYRTEKGTVIESPLSEEVLLSIREKPGI